MCYISFRMATGGEKVCRGVRLHVCVDRIGDCPDR
ncbi:hypothetical protein BJY24_001849 [Nocardia transvalensis]|uniref:Uncharacterized protein n=1 Tax=Nocardia transvalensis TaxID=37333 RepID=A0A7W9PBD5_9NOCA|nr:hypothetical protein [Nocardia transvalensis]